MSFVSLCRPYMGAYYQDSIAKKDRQRCLRRINAVEINLSGKINLASLASLYRTGPFEDAPLT